MSRRKLRDNAPTPQPKTKSPQQLAQWAAYEALCRQRDEEATVRHSVARMLEEKRKVATAKLNAAEEISLNVQLFTKAQELRCLAKAVMQRVSPTESGDVMSRAKQWEQDVLALAEALDPIAEILSSFDQRIREI